MTDHDLVTRLKASMAARFGIPARLIRKEQQERLRKSDSQLPRRRQPAARGTNQHPRLPAGTPPVPPGTNVPHSRPALDAQQHAFLTFLSNHPAVPIATVAKGLKLRAVTATEIRENLKTQGLIHELEIRPTRTGAGRPLKCLLPTMQAFDLLGSEPPAGRGGMLYRHLQQLIAQGAAAKGYTAQCEKELRTGAIVDVHLERGGEKVAVEIAVASHPSRELAHIRQHLTAGYDKVFTVFADSQLLERTREAMRAVFSDEERSRVQLIPVSRLTGVG